MRNPLRMAKVSVWPAPLGSLICHLGPVLAAVPMHVRPVVARMEQEPMCPWASPVCGGGSELSGISGLVGDCQAVGTT